MRAELALLRGIFLDKEKYKLCTPISYIVERDPDFTALGDACLDGAGGYSVDLKFFWFFEWPVDIKKRTLKGDFKVRINIEKDKFISINLLEYLTIIISYAGAIQALRDKKISMDYPLISIDSDNTSAVSWTKKVVLTTTAGKALAHIC